MPFCVECGVEKSATAKFCSECGHGPGSAPPPPPPPPGQPPATELAPGISDFGQEFPHPGPLPKPPRFGDLPTRLGKMGIVRGRTEAEIVSWIGPASSRSAAGGGTYLLQWQNTAAYSRSWHYALIFDSNGVCGGITHEFIH